jgi:hypothetical protein
MKPETMVADRELYRFGDRRYPDRTKRIVEIQILFRDLRDSDRGRRDADVALDHYAWLIDGSVRMDKFLASAAPWMPIEERKQRKDAAFCFLKTYDAVVLGKLIGLTCAVRREHKITTIRPMDEPPAEVREILHKAADAAYRRQRRAILRLLPKSPSISQRKAAELLSRRRAAILAALPPDDWLAVADLCEVLKRLKNGPFYGVSASSFPGVVRRVIKASGLRTEKRPIAGRRDLQDAMWVTREPEPSHCTRETTMTTTDTEHAIPINEQEYLIHFAARLAEFEPGPRMVDELYYFFVAERKLQVACGISDHSELLKMVRARRDEITRPRHEKA